MACESSVIDLRRISHLFEACGGQNWTYLGEFIALSD